MTIGSLDVVFYTAVFLLPGFIIKSIIDVLNPPKKRSDSVFFLSCLAYSLVNCAVCSWAYILIQPLFEDNVVGYWIVFLGITLLGAIIVSIIIGIIKQKRVIYKIAGKRQIKFIDPTPTAWDYWFSKQNPSLVFITLMDGSQIRGWYGGKSFASSEHEERDLFIEKVYRKATESDQWEDDPGNNGIYISKDTIKLIEFKSQKGIQ